MARTATRGGPAHGQAGESGRDERLAALAKALGHPARIRIVRLIAARDACFVGELADELPLAQSTVSEHLRILREAGLVHVGRMEDGRPCYCLERRGIQALAEGVSGL